MGQAGDIVRAIPQQRHAALDQGGNHQFSGFSLRRGLLLFIQNLRQEGILPDVQALLGLALHGHARAHHFGQAVNIMRLDMQHLFNARAHAFAPRLRAENACFQLHSADIYALFLHGLGQVDRIGGRTAQSRRAKILHQRQLALGVAAAGRHHRRVSAS